jgi:uncharacterized protein
MSGTTPFDCPRCGVVLSMSERQGIEIDYCPQCRGVWLDRGELDKIVGMSETAGEASPSAQPTPGSPAAGGWIQPDAPPPPAQQPWTGEHRGHHYDDDDDDERRDYGHGGKRRSSWLKNLFD